MVLAMKRNIYCKDMLNRNRCMNHFSIKYRSSLHLLSDAQFQSFTNFDTKGETIFRSIFNMFIPSNQGSCL